MAVTKIKCRTSGTDKAIQYILNGDKTRRQILTARLNCDPGYEYRQMKDTKEYFGKDKGRQCYHIIISYKPGEITPEFALQIAEEFARENLSDYEVVMAVHTDKSHIHSHIIFNSVSLNGEKYRLGRGGYYRKIRDVSDRLCRKYGLSVIPIQEEASQSVSYAEWLRQSRGQPTFRSMLEADLRDAIEDAATLGDFFVLMEQKDNIRRHGAAFENV